MILGFGLAILHVILLRYIQMYPNLQGFAFWPFISVINAAAGFSGVLLDLKLLN